MMITIASINQQNVFNCTRNILRKCFKPKTAAKLVEERTTAEFHVEAKNKDFEV